MFFCMMYINANLPLINLLNQLQQQQNSYYVEFIEKTKTTSRVVNSSSKRYIYIYYKGINNDLNKLCH